LKAIDWLIPDWPAPAHVRAVFTTRFGGCSNPPWGSLNLGDHVGDVPEHVEANRAMLHQAIGSRPVFLKQVHGVGVEHLGLSTPDGTLADACITTECGLACTIMVADCLPVLLTTTDGTCVAAAHAGWRGLAGVDENGNVGEKGILEAVFSAFQVKNRPVSPSKLALVAPEIIAWLGPCIGPTAFEVGAEVLATFEASQPGAGQFFKAKTQGKSERQSANKYLADLAGLARARLQTLGITRLYGNDSTAEWCTVSNPSMFFSHRRDAGRTSNGLDTGIKTTGRMAACVWIS
jgi:hypothetical protein